MDTLEIVVRVSQFFASAALVIVAFTVYRYTKRRDRLEFLRAEWVDAQAINIATISNSDVAKSIEKAIYGRELKEEDRISVDYFLFLYLNRIHQAFLAYNEGLIDRAAYLRNTAGTLKLLANQQDRIRYLLLERGYSVDFLKDISTRFSVCEVVPPRHSSDLNVSDIEKRIAALKSKNSIG